MTPEMLAKARTAAAAMGASNVEFIEAERPFRDESFDVIISNGVIDLIPDKDAVFAELFRVLAPGGRMQIADVTIQPVRAEGRRNIDLWAACIAGAVPRDNYVQAIEDQGLQVERVRDNDYRFTSERALEACSIYEVESLSLLAVKTS